MCFATFVGLLVVSSGTSLVLASAATVPGAASGPSVAFTLVLANDTLLRGNGPVRGEVTTPDPQGMAFDPSNGDVYVAVPRSNSIIVIDGRTDLVADNVTVGFEPIDVALDPNNGYLYAVNGLDDHISVIDGTTNSVAANVTTGANPTAVAFDSSNGTSM